VEYGGITISIFSTLLFITHSDMIFLSRLVFLCERAVFYFQLFTLAGARESKEPIEG